MLTAIIVVTAITICTSFFCSLAEAALLSISASRVEALRVAGDRRGTRLHHLRSEIDRPISAVLILNTIAHSAGAVIAGALVGQEYGNEFLGAFTAALTFAILYLSEIIPKSLGAAHANRLAPRLALSLELLVLLLLPLVWTCLAVTRLLRRRGPHDMGEEDVLALASLGAKHGAILPIEAKWVRNALRLDAKSAHDIMTPRTVVYTLPDIMPLSEVKTNSAHWRHSRLPVVQDNRPDRVVGVALRRDIFDAVVAGETEQTIGDLMHQALFVPETMPGHRLLQTFIDERQHLAVVVDEFGGMEGVVTLEDVLEELVGVQIVDETDEHEDMRQLARDRAAELGIPVSDSGDDDDPDTDEPPAEASPRA